jgi:hypothetical protein
MRDGVGASWVGSTIHLGQGAVSPPRRPVTEAELPFQRCAATRWFNPSVLAITQFRVVFSGLFGAFLDKRELQAALPDTPITDFADEDELWVDYVADTGDGFDPTYLMAWLLAQPSLRISDLTEPLPRGDLLVLGGDQVYPVPSPQGYEDRLVGPFRAALPWSAEPPTLLALPGNHDWYDGLTAFMRVFAQDHFVGGWRTRQHRSYFAVQLPHRWWLWGVDSQLDSYLDAPQLAYFEALDVRPGDGVILCTARPGWVHAGTNPAGFRNHAYVQRRLIEERGAHLAVSLSGDYHHYARYEDTHGSHKITAGGGGAFLHPTHSLPPATTIRIAPDRLDEAEPEPVRFTLAACFPERSRSRRLLRRALVLPLRNPWFMVLPAALHALVLWTSQFSVRAAGRQAVLETPDLATTTLAAVAASFATPSTVLVLIVVLGALVHFAKPPRRFTARPRARRVVKWVMGGVHWAAQVAAVAVTLWLAMRLVAPTRDSLWSIVALFVVTVALGGAVGGMVMGVYLWVCNRLPVLHTHDNEAFAAIRHPGHKNCARLHIGRDGALTIYPIGVDDVSRWRLDATGTDSAAPWFAPDGDPPRPKLIEDPITLRPDASMRQPGARGAAFDTDPHQ